MRITYMIHVSLPVNTQKTEYFRSCQLCDIHYMSRKGAGLAPVWAQKKGRFVLVGYLSGLGL
jgi:hypothetical protein